MVYHILKDGTRTTDITGRVVPFKDAEGLYQYVADLNRPKNGRRLAKGKKKEVAV